MKSCREDRVPKECIFSFKVLARDNNMVGKKERIRVAAKDGKRKRISVPVTLIISNMVYSPSKAAENIGVSVSTLRRRFAELANGTNWPITELEWEETHARASPIDNKASISALVHEKNTKNCVFIDSITQSMLKVAFQAHLH